MDVQGQLGVDVQGQLGVNVQVQLGVQGQLGPPWLADAYIRP